MKLNNYALHVLEILKDRHSSEKEYIQAITHFLYSISPILDIENKYKKYSILERLLIPDRIIIFKVPWISDKNKINVNTAYRVQFNNTIGPYKGGLRFHPSVNLSILKFLGFEQIFKNSLTGFPIGGAKGGSDFDPKGKSDYEVLKFCQNFMRELSRYIGPDVDVPAGDIGVGKREIGFLFGQYKKIINAHRSSITGKSIAWGGSHLRTEATGYGLIYFTETMLNNNDLTLQDKKILISGAGNVALHAAEKAIKHGAKVMSLSDSNGCIIVPEGLSEEIFLKIKNLKINKRGRIKEITKHFNNISYYHGKKPWQIIPCDIALPCATQNELNKNDAEILAKNGCLAVAEGANMPSTGDAVKILQSNKILFAPGKASNAGGVAVSSLEMAQNATTLQWKASKVDSILKKTMGKIFNIINQTSEEYGCKENFVLGANIAGFKKVADSMIDLGV
ncbi:MAG: NADP-specific glutamate dehydrogenase [bacterium]|nr:NADP-specific glutamate dehydrogenase [bacterium]